MKSKQTEILDALKPGKRFVRLRDKQKFEIVRHGSHGEDSGLVYVRKIDDTMVFALISSLATSLTRARTYVGTGDEQEKLAFLRSRAPIDYLVAQPFPIPPRFHITLVDGSGKKKVAATSVSSLNLMGGLIVLFEDAIRELESALPAQNTLSIPQSPLFCMTSLMADSEDILHPVTAQNLR